ncbi:hypothetical protein ACOMHN_038306 [Nucella lapillus]
MNTWRSINASNPNASTPHAADEVPVTSLPLHRLAMSLWTAGLPTLLVLGTAGNVMSILIMRSMTGGDLVALWTGAVKTLSQLAPALAIPGRWDLLYFLFLPGSLIAGNFGCCIIVLLTLQRAFSVAWPHHIHRLFTRARVFYMIAGAAAFETVVYSHHWYCVYFLLATDYNGFQCLTLPSSKYVWFLDNVFIYLAMGLTGVLPFLCLVIGNAVLVFTLILSVRQVNTKIATGNSQLSLKRQKEAVSVTVTIVVVSVAFIALIFPVYIYVALYWFEDQSKMSSQKRAEVFLFYTLTSLLTSSNNAINFYLYCLTGRRFRQEFVNILKCKAKIRP